MKSSATQSVSIIIPFLHVWPSFTDLLPRTPLLYWLLKRSKLSDILGWFATMRWLMIGLLVSLGAMLFAAGALARHIWLHRQKLRLAPHTSLDAHETDVESER